MRYIAEVTTTLKKGCNVTLGPKTVVYGPNGSGKSTIIQAIELATCGWASDMEGRDRVKLSRALARMFPKSVMKYSKCKLSSGEEFSWELLDGVKEGSYKNPNHTSPIAVSWPIQDLMAILGGDEASVQAWLEKEVFDGTSEEEALEKLPPAVRPSVKALMAKKKKTDFLGLAKDARSDAKALRAQATRTEKTIDALVEGIQPPLTDTSRSGLEKAISGLSEQPRFVTQEEYDLKRAELEALAGEVAVFKNTLLSSTPQSAIGKMEVLRRVQLSLSIIDQHKKGLGDVEEYCWCCGSQGEGEHEVKLLTALTHLEDVSALQGRRRNVEVLLAAAEGKLVSDAADLMKMKVGSNEEKFDLMNKLVADNTARKAWLNAEAARKEVAQLRAKADLLTSSAKSLSSVGKDLLCKAKVGLEHKISAFLPEGESVEIDLTNARIGMARDGEIHSALSGAEWSRVLLAIASALSNSSTLNVLIPQDRAWDKDTLEFTMQALSSSPFQVVVMSTVKPDPIEGWTLIDLTA